MNDPEIEAKAEQIEAGMCTPVRSSGEIKIVREKAADAIRAFCQSLSPAAVQMSHGQERIYYAGLSLDALSVAVALALSQQARAGGVAQGWQDIATAPQDGNPVIVWDDPVTGEAYFDIAEKSWWWANTGPGDYTAEAIYPTLWQPMPTAPSVPSTPHQTVAGRTDREGGWNAERGLSIPSTEGK